MRSGPARIPPGLYFRMILVGYFEGLDSQRGIAWRCATASRCGNSSVFPQRDDARSFDLDPHPPTASAGGVPGGVPIRALHGRGEAAPSGKTVGVDSTTLEANAAMKSIVRRDTGEDWQEYVSRLMERRGDRGGGRADRGRAAALRQKRKEEGQQRRLGSPTDPESRITQMKDGRTHLAYKAEHVVDLKSDLVLAAEIRATRADTPTMVDSVMKPR